MGDRPAPPALPRRFQHEIIATIRAGGAQPLRNAYGVANTILRETAASTGAGLVDIARRFAPLCPDWKCPDLLFFDDHPVDKGHQIAAEELLKGLVEMGVIQTTGSPGPTPTGRDATAPRAG
jgi:hypothetical protein